ncbi:hypothetical protein lerEdw1_007374 [Lerista edwardsae]|nr:hypothetical protein lerEdw1_007374 [Lerista edwardsae]
MAGGGGGGGRCPRRTRSAGEARAGLSAGAVLGLESDIDVTPRRCSALPSNPPLCLRRCRPFSPEAQRPAPFAVRPITLKKIVPRSRQVSGREDKENVPVSPGRDDAGTELGPLPLRCPPVEPAAGDPPGGTVVLSPVSGNAPGSPPGDEWDLAMAKRVRRSYSRLEISLSQSFLENRSPGLGDTSTPDGGPGKRHTLFGFEKLLLPDEVAGLSAGGSRAPPKAAETAGEPHTPLEPDTDLPGIAFGKEKRRKKKMPQFEKSELDQWAAEMNAEFAEAERFDLLVE